MNIAHVLKKNGYTTGFVGKFHVGDSPDGVFFEDVIPLSSQSTTTSDTLNFFEKVLHEIGFLTQRVNPHASRTISSESLFLLEKWSREQIKNLGFSWAKNVYWENFENPYNTHNPGWTLDAALEFLEDNQTAPFFLHYGSTLTHGRGRRCRSSIFEPLISGEGVLENPPEAMASRKSQALHLSGLWPSPQKFCTSWLDASLGVLLDKLDELGIADNTVFIFVSDHGITGKGSLFDKNGTNIPAIIRWPRKIVAGSHSHAMIQNIDFAPTFFEIAGAEVPPDYHIDGGSLVPIFEANAEKLWRESLYFEIGAARAVRTDNWKYIAVRYTKKQSEKVRAAQPSDLVRELSYINSGGIGVRGARNRPNFFDQDQLYFLPEDPFERENLATLPQYSEQLATMKHLLKNHLQKQGRPFGDFIPGEDTAPAGELEAQIKAVKQIKLTRETMNPGRP